MLPRFAWCLLSCAIAGALALGCAKANPSYCDTSTQCGVGVCDEAGAFGERNACIEGDCANFQVQCTADMASEVSCDSIENQFATVNCGTFGCNAGRASCNECAPSTTACTGDGASGVRTECDAQGLIVNQDACAFGCRQDGSQTCIDIEPSNGLAADLDYIDNNPTTIRELILEDGYVVNSDGTILDGAGEELANIDTRSVPQEGAKPIRVFRVGRLTITGMVAIVGTDEAVAFVSNSDIFINGELEVHAGDIFNESAPPSCMGKDGPGDGSNRPGSGGGGFGTVGLPGGSTDGSPPDSGVGGAGGTIHGTEDLQPLVGGCGSIIPFDEGNDPDAKDTRGGGALQLVSRTKIALGPQGRLGARGDGGHGADIDANGNIASGGGSGGGLLLEAPEVVLDADAFISANSGGGGGGCAGESERGEPGRFSTVAALGANCTTDPDSGSGGTGAALTNPTSGMSILGRSNASGGGGGGGVGRIRVNNSTGTLSSFDGFSPIPSVGPAGKR